MTILLATTNPHKLDEIRAIFESLATPARPAPLLVSLADLKLAQIPEPVEDLPTFEDNAILKARYYARHANHLCMADDSGLEVDALGGAPGVLSARYAGIHTGGRSVIDPANNKLLLQNLAGVPLEKRTARFVCAIALVDPHIQPQNDTDRSDVLALVRGTVEGRILTPDETSDPTQPHRGRGAHGFGYDPIFLISEKNKTTAELSPAEKNAISHRGRAARKLWEQGV